MIPTPSPVSMQQDSKLSTIVQHGPSLWEFQRSLPANTVSTHSYETRVKGIKEQTIVRSGDRKLVFYEEGPADAPVVFHLHGMFATHDIWLLPEPPKTVRVVAITRAGI